MRAVRFLTLALLMVVGVAGTAKAQAYNNTPGTYEVKVGVVPAVLPPGSLPPEASNVGPDLYAGTLVIARNADGTYAVSFKGERQRVDGAKLNVNATFNSDWAGIKIGSLVVGSSLEDNVVIGIDGANLISANINGVGTVDGKIQRVIAKFGAGAMLDAVQGPEGAGQPALAAASGITRRGPSRGPPVSRASEVRYAGVSRAFGKFPLSFRSTFLATFLTTAPTPCPAHRSSAASAAASDVLT